MKIKPDARPKSDVLGDYQLLERIAIGGMAEVWKARKKGLEGFQKTVAIKRILPHLTDSSDFVTMFIDEAKLAAQLDHNHIIHIHDLGKAGDDFYIAMEYVEGKDLRSILNTARQKGRSIPLGLSLFIASRLANALDYAHRKTDVEGRELCLVHRDVSPQNVLISYEGEIKLCDFGIVKAVTKASKTQMGALKGKLQYMSPEQAWGRPVDARSDIFSLGSILFEMLTGRRLFAGDSEMSVLEAVREGRIQAPRDLDARLPLEVNTLVLRALAKEPGERFQTAGEMQREIEKVLFALKPTPSQGDLAAFVRHLFDVEAPAAAPTADARHGAGIPAPERPRATPRRHPARPVTPAAPVVAPATDVEVTNRPGPQPLPLYGGIGEAHRRGALLPLRPWRWQSPIAGTAGVTLPERTGAGRALPPRTGPALAVPERPWRRLRCQRPLPTPAPAGISSRPRNRRGAHSGADPGTDSGTDPGAHADPTAHPGAHPHAAVGTSRRARRARPGRDSPGPDQYRDARLPAARTPAQGPGRGGRGAARRRERTRDRHPARQAVPAGGRLQRGGAPGRPVGHLPAGDEGWRAGEGLVSGEDPV